MIKLIVFDLWQTLVYRDVGYSTTSKILEKTKMNISKKRFIKIFEKSIQTKKWKSKFEAYKNLCKKIGLKTTKQNIKILMDIRDKAEDKTKVYPYTISILKQLRKQGYKIGLISNSSVFATKKVKQKTKLLKFIDYPLFSFDVGKVKPDIKLFKRMLKIAKCKPEEAIMIGDKKSDDVVPARKIGMNAILFKNYKQLKKDLRKFNIHLI